MANINRVVLVGNLTKDPELVHADGTAVCKIRWRQHAPEGWETGEGATSTTTSTSPSGATRARAARSTSRRAARSPRRATRLARVEAQDGTKRKESRSSPTPFSSRLARRRRGGRSRSSTRRRDAREPNADSGAGCLTTTSPSRMLKKTERGSRAARAAAAAAGGASGPLLPGGGRAVTSARTRSTRWTGRTTTSFAGTSPRRARSARGGSRGPAVATRSRSRSPSSAPARWRCCLTSRTVKSSQARRREDRRRARVEVARGSRAILAARQLARRDALAGAELEKVKRPPRTPMRRRDSSRHRKSRSGSPDRAALRRQGRDTECSSVVTAPDVAKRCGEAQDSRRP